MHKKILDTNIYVIGAVLIGVLTFVEIAKLLLPYYSYSRALVVIAVVCVFLFIHSAGYNLKKIEYILKDIYSRFHTHIITQRLRNYISLYRDKVVYGSFIALVVILCISVAWDTGKIFFYSVIAFYILFFVGKIFGFSLKLKFPKYNMTSNSIRFFLITAGLYFVFVSLMMQSFGIEGFQKWLYLFGAVLVYIIGGITLFFEKSILKRTFLTPYNAFMGMLVICLLGYILFQNLSLSDEIEIVSETIVREPGIPGIISDEAYLERINNPESFIQYTQVSELYDISPGIQLGSITDDVSELQEVLSVLEYFEGDISGNFEEDTQEALINTLKTECEWPESTRGIFGPQAKECIDNLEIPDTRVSTSILPDLSAVISDEASLELVEEELGENIEAIEEEENIEVTPEIIEEDEVSLEPVEEEIITDSSILVIELYDITPGIALGSSGDDVVELQEVLQVLNYYDGEISGNFDENTQSALVNTLRGECAWPESTRGIFGPLAKVCIDNLIIPIN